MASRPTLTPAYSNKRKREWLRADAYAALLRMTLRMVPGSGENFSIYSAGRDRAEQERLFRAAYTPVSRGRGPSTDRAFQGRIWALKSGHLPVASPDFVGGSVGTHRQGRAVDIHPAAIQNWIKSNGRRFGWSWTNGRRLGEHHHFEYEPSLDRYKGEGTPDISGMQRKLGITVDGKVGTGFVSAIRKYQQDNGLTVDGIAGPDTQRAILGGKAPAKPSKPAPDKKLKAASKLDIDRSKTSPNTHKDRIDPRDGKKYQVKHITLHWWGTPSGQSHSGIVSHLCNRAAEVSAHYVVSPGKVSQIIDEKHSSWANGNRVANFESITIEADPNDILGTLPYVAALIADIRSRHGDLTIYPHNHWTGTECCGDYIPLLDDIDAMAGGATVEVTLTGSAGTPGTVGVDGRLGRETSAELQGRLGVTQDGMLGPVSIKALQRYLGAPYVDGKISRQPKAAKDLGNGYRKDLIEVGSGDSQMVRLWQAYVGATVDGRLGGETIRRTQVQLNASPASFTSDHAETVKLRTKGVLSGASSTPAKSKRVDEDGRAGRETIAELQRQLGVKADGRAGESTWKALQRKLGVTPADGKIGWQSYKPAELGNGIVDRKTAWGYTGRGSKGSPTVRALQKHVGVRADGVWGEGTTKALQKALNAGRF